MKVFIQAMDKKIPPEKVLKHLTDQEKKDLQGKTLEVYAIGKEGLSRPKVLDGVGQKVLRWTKATIRQLADTLKPGTKFFKAHGRNTNSHNGREEVGKSVKTFTIPDDDGKLMAVTASVLDEDKTQGLDVCSIEANIDYDDTGLVTDVYDTTAVALGSSDKDSPAFEGAVKMATIQCFLDENIDKDKVDNREDKAVTFDELKKAVRDMNVYPSQLYTMEQIQKDRAFTDFFDEAKKNGEDNKKMKEELEKLENESKDSREKALKSDAKERLEKMYPEGITDKQKEFVTLEFKKGLTDYSDEGIKTFLNTTIENFSSVAKMFNGDEKPGNGSAEGKTPADELEKLAEEFDKMGE